MHSSPVIRPALLLATLATASLTTGVFAQPVPNPPPSDARVALERAQAHAAASPNSAAAQVDLAIAQQRVGKFVQAFAALAEAERLDPGHVAIDAGLSGLLVDWHTADPPRPGQASAYGEVCAAAQHRLGAPSGDRLAQLAHATCTRLAAADLVAERGAAGPVGNANAALPRAVTPALTPEKVLRIWAITAVGAALFIGGATWLTRKQRGKGPPKP